MPVGRAFGIPPELLPPDLDAFEAYMERMLAPGGPIVVGDTARELAETILRPPLAPALGAFGSFGEGLGEASPRLSAWLEAIPPAAYEWLMWPAVGLLPKSVRDGYGPRWGVRLHLNHGQDRPAALCDAISGVPATPLAAGNW